MRGELARAKAAEAAVPTTGLSLTGVELELRVATQLQADGSVKLAILSASGKQTQEVSHLIRLRFATAPEGAQTLREALLDLSPLHPRRKVSRSRKRRRTS